MRSSTQYYYIRNGTDVNVIDNKGSTPLHWAAYSGSYQAINFLITWGSKLNMRDRDTGFTALHLAAMQGNKRIVRRLLIKGIDRTIKDFSGKTALDYAKESNFRTIVTMIVKQFVIFRKTQQV
jgi:palmitoyltransferase